MTDTTHHHHTDVRYELVAETGTDYPSEPPLRLVRRVLRGRYTLVAALAVTLAAGGGYVGYHAVPPVYESTGLVRIEGSRPAILYETHENRVPPMFDAYIASQVTYLKSHQVLDVAAASPELHAAGWPDGPSGVAALQGALSVRRGRGEKMIKVAVANPDPALAQTAVNAVLATYERLVMAESGLNVSERESTLAGREASLVQELEDIRARILEVSNQYGPAALTRMHQGKVEELMALDRKLADLRLAQSGVMPHGAAPILPVASASRDPLAGLRAEHASVQAELASLRARYGASHSMIREMSRRITALRHEIGLREQTLAAAGTMSVEPVLPEDAATNAERLAALELEYESRRAVVHEDVAALGHQRTEAAALAEREREVKKLLAETRHRLDALSVETQRGDLSRVTVDEWGDLSVSPVSDRRRGLAAAGSLFGLVAGTGLVFLFGLFDPRLRYVEEMEVLDAGAPTIGVLPELEKNKKQIARRAERSVHQLRNLLELQCIDPNRNVCTITSPARGEGKTSLTIALGSSFAAAGRKTLVIDADVATSSLSRELGLGESTGLCEAIGPGNNASQVHPTREENLWAMPIGSAHGLDPQDLSRTKLIQLLDALRSRFDAILIDTGPILTSVEACLVAGVSDRTVVVVRRNQRGEPVRSALALLEQVSATCIGTVFNRAVPGDFREREIDQKNPSHSIAPLIRPTRQGRRNQLGPLAQVVHGTPTAVTDGGQDWKQAA